MRHSHRRLQRALHMTALVIAGEAIFSLPFHLARFFRPTVLAALGFTNTELGAAQAVYGVAAMLAYFPGGPLADRFEARGLLVLSLVSTSAGGLYFATAPSFTGMSVLFGYWGFTTILLFWAALIRATRDWGAADEQGRAYGILDGGRGMLAAGLASAAAVAFRVVFPEDAASVTDGQRLDALRWVIYGYAAVTSGAAALVWFFVPAKDVTPSGGGRTASELVRHVGRVVRLPAVWLQAMIVVCAYVAYKGFDNYSLFAHQGYGLDEVEAGTFTAAMQWVRPLAAVGAGFLGDRFRCSRLVIAGFGILLATDLLFAVTAPDPAATWILFTNVTITCVAIFGLRGIYFALFEEAAVPVAITGTAVGLVSVIGYTPDIFVGLVAGILLDDAPGIIGHQRFFYFLAAFAAVGLVAAVLFERRRVAALTPAGLLATEASR